MCERRDSIRALGAAADELLLACCSRPRSFRQAVQQSVFAPTPAEFTDLLDKIETADQRRKGKRHAGRH